MNPAKEVTTGARGALSVARSKDDDHSVCNRNASEAERLRSNELR